MSVVNLPRIGAVDLDHLPENFDGMVYNGFMAYTDGTAKEFRFVDKLAFIDLCNRYLHNVKEGEDAVREIILDQEEFSLNEYGDLPDRDDYWSLEFLGYLYDEGARSRLLYRSGDEDKYKIGRILIRIIKDIIDC